MVGAGRQGSLRGRAQARLVMGIHVDELDRVFAGRFMTLRTMPLDKLPVGAGEWDWRRVISRKRLRKLIGARYLTSTGEKPDVFAEVIIDNVAGIDNIDDAIDWYIKTALKAITESRRERHHRRHLRHARANGFATYYEYRRAQALDNGHGSLWYMRKDRGWD